MGGVDKGLVEFDGRPLIEHVITRIKPQLDNIMISANRNIAQYQRYGYSVLKDTQRGIGPLAGILQALQRCQTRWLLTLPCDTPCISEALVTRLLVATAESDASLFTASDGDKLQPLFSLINRDLTPSLQRYLDSGERKVSQWLEQQGTASVEFSEMSEMFVNLNTAESIKEMTDESDR